MAKARVASQGGQRRRYRRGYVGTDLLSNLPGFNLNDKNFFEMTGARKFIGNQTRFAKNISSQLQNIFKTHIRQSGVEFQYFTEEKLNKKFNQLDNTCQFSIFHLNIRSLNCNHKSLQILLGSLNHSYNIICLSEVWNVNLSFLTTIFPEYKCVYQEALSSKTGGVAVFYKKGYKVEKMKEYNINPNKDLTLDVDDLWMHIETDQNVKTLLGVIYRHPKGNISAFNDKLSATLEKIRSNKSIETCFIAGDFNIDISQYYTHYPTENFLDILSSHTFLPTILMPTRITYHSATLIDNIYLFQGKTKSNQ